MDEQRYRELDAKRQGEGLTEEEANELGKLEAKRMGKEYEGNADDPPLEVRAERVGADPEEVTEAEVEVKENRDVDDSVQTPERLAGEQVDAPPPA
ncbi:MAG: hypothetical protein M3135_02470 [Actinomycetota bacterium]|nr:hypothetical protein [Actinomycetota bacterium]